MVGIVSSAGAMKDGVMCFGLMVSQARKTNGDITNTMLLQRFVSVLHVERLLLVVACFLFSCYA